MRRETSAEFISYIMTVSKFEKNVKNGKNSHKQIYIFNGIFLFDSIRLQLNTQVHFSQTKLQMKILKRGLLQLLH